MVNCWQFINNSIPTFSRIQYPLRSSIGFSSVGTPRTLAFPTTDYTPPSGPMGPTLLWRRVTLRAPRVLVPPVLITPHPTNLHRHRDAWRKRPLRSQWSPSIATGMRVGNHHRHMDPSLERPVEHPRKCRLQLKSYQQLTRVNRGDRQSYSRLRRYSNVANCPLQSIISDPEWPIIVPTVLDS